MEVKSVVLHASGRVSLEARCMYQLFGRMYGSDNFPDSPNMCHETTSVALPPVIGVAEDVVTRFLDDQRQARGRPAGVAIDKTGALLVADDIGNTVWRVTAAR